MSSYLEHVLYISTKSPEFKKAPGLFFMNNVINHMTNSNTKVDYNLGYGKIQTNLIIKRVYSKYCQKGIHLENTKQQDW